MAADPQVLLDEPRPATTEPVLRPVLSVKWALHWRHVIVIALFSALFLAINHLPIRGTDIWGHVAIGHWIADHRALPTEDPFQPLAEGMRYVDTAWLAQLMFAGVEQLAGAEGLSNLFAVVVLATYLLLARSYWQLSGRVSVSMFVVGLVLTVGFSRLTTLRPEVLSLACFALLQWLVARYAARHDGDATAAEPDRTLWLAVPALLVFWCNLHGSFVYGVMFLGALGLGRMIDTGWRERSIRAALADRAGQRWTWLAELSLLVTLVNPHGLDQWIEVARFDSNRVVQQITEWQPLAWHGSGAYEFAAGLLVFLIVLRQGKRSLRAADVILLALLAWQALNHHRTLSWLALGMGWVLTPHLAEMFGRWFPTRPEPACSEDDLADGRLPPGRSWRWLMAGAMILWMTFSFSGISRFVLGGKPRSPEALYGENTPWHLTEHLRANPPTGQIYNPQWWGDWLAWDGPQGLKVFATTNLHLMPWQVWADHQRIGMVEAGWDAALDRYSINTVVVDKKYQPSLARFMRRMPEWTVQYEDEQGLVCVRKRKPKPTTTEATPLAAHRND